ncbi:MAG: peptidoglycan recognition protein family protein [Planctomycetota bacterium]|jgi:N-acetyl-anhydromuramyl-L-alanine amidase AmpD
MSSKYLIFWGCVFVLGGCIYNDEPMPEIARVMTPKPRVVSPVVKQPATDTPKVYQRIPRSWLPPRQIEKKWKAIIIHHSGTKNGNMAIFDKEHEDRRWAGVGYDFVIGNGTDSGNGQIEVTFRWREQKVGAHCKVPGNWANKEAIGICLVGDFTRRAPTTRQMQSLVKLVRFLQRRYSIPKNRIYGHKTTPGARVTDCPGKRFPMTKLKSAFRF